MFKIRRNGFERVLTAFKNADGANPYAGLTELNGSLYGTTAFGGSAGKGTVFRIDQNGTEKLIYSFKGGSDGLYPFANLIVVGGVLYGTTTGGGGSGTGCGGEGCGTVFKVTPTGSESVIYAFQGGNDGAGPEASLTYVNGVLYGTTTGGSGTGCGGPGCGTVFEVDGSGNETILYSFGDASTGGYPAAPLTYRAGYFYGTTYTGGGTNCPLNGGIGCGTVFKLSTSGHESVLHAFQGGTDGAHPYSGLVFAGGLFYGTTYGGGNNGCAVGQGCGTVYRIKP